MHLYYLSSVTFGYMHEKGGRAWEVHATTDQGADLGWNETRQVRMKKVLDDLSENKTSKEQALVRILELIEEVDDEIRTNPRVTSGESALKQSRILRDLVYVMYSLHRQIKGGIG